MDEVKPAARVPTVEHRKPCEPRGSRTVLGAPGGEIPPGDSTNCENLGASISRLLRLRNRTLLKVIDLSASGPGCVKSPIDVMILRVNRRAGAMDVRLRGRN